MNSKTKKQKRPSCFGLFTITSLKCHDCKEALDCDHDFSKDMGYNKNYIIRIKDYTGLEYTKYYDNLKEKLKQE